MAPHPARQSCSSTTEQNLTISHVRKGSNSRGGRTNGETATPTANGAPPQPDESSSNAARTNVTQEVKSAESSFLAPRGPAAGIPQRIDRRRRGEARRGRSPPVG